MLSISVNSRFRPYRIILPRQGGSINIIQVTVYSFTVPALKLMNVKFCLFLATTAHCHDRAAIKIHITTRTFNRINLHVRCGNLHNFNCFWLSIEIYKYIYLGAGKHPSPLDISESYSPDLYLKVGFYLIKKYCSCPKLSQFKDRALLLLVPAPI